MSESIKQWKNVITKELVLTYAKQLVLCALNNIYLTLKQLEFRPNKICLHEAQKKIYANCKDEHLSRSQFTNSVPLLFLVCGY